jgi:uncharacterized membrane protein
MIQELSLANRNLIDLLVVEIFAIVAVAAVLSSAATAAVLPLFALPLVFVVPGYALTVMLFPKRKFGYPELLAYSLGLSLVADILGGLVINATSQGLNVSSWTLWLGAVTLCSSIIAALRRPPDFNPGWRLLRLNLSVPQGLMLGLSVIVAVSAIMLARDRATPSSSFTELWVLPATTVDPNGIQFGVRNLESAKMEYSLEVKEGNEIVYTASIDLLPGETWTRAMVLQIPRNEVQVLLYRADNPAQVYREVSLPSREN